MSRAPAILLLVLLGLFACAPAAHAEPVKVKGKVVSVRKGRIYIELSGGEPLEPGRRVVIQRGGEKLPGRLLGVSTKYALVEVAQDVVFEPDQRVTLLGDVRAPRSAPEAKAGASKPVASAGITIGRSTPTYQEFLQQPLPKRELVAFRGVAQAAPEEGEDAAVVEDEGKLIDNEVSGAVEVGVDGAFKDEGRTAETTQFGVGKISRTTPYGRLSLRVDRLGGSDRARLLFYGSVRQPFGGGADWTNRNTDQLNARFSALVFQLDAKPSGQIEEFTDRLELAVGRDTVRSVVEAGIVDGVQAGLRFGPLTPFVFGGVAAALNPRHEDYDSLIWGGGIRLEHAFSHSGSVRFSVAGALERFRSGEEGGFLDDFGNLKSRPANERGFVESQFDLRLGSFGARGALVYDVFSSLRNERRNRVTTGQLLLYSQVTSSVRVEAGYRERRPVYTAELIAIDLDLEYQPLARRDLEEGARRNLWVTLQLRFSDRFDMELRAEHYQGHETREANGGELSFGVNDLIGERDRLSLDLALRHRQKGNGIGRHSSEPFFMLSYTNMSGEYRWGVSAIYRAASAPIADQRVAGRFWFDADLTETLLLRGYAQVDMVRAERNRETLFLVGASLRYRF